MPRPTRAPERLVALALVAALASCAKKGPPSGGPPDLEPPRIVSTVPDSGAAAVAPHTRIAVTFSEGMEPRTTGDAVELAPPIGIKQRRWSGRTLTLLLEDSLRAERTYTLFVGSGARDRHGNPLADARAVVFTTAGRFPIGVLAGRVDAVGFKAGGTALWCYREGHAPDSTARDFDGLGVADAAGHFRIAGLTVPGRWQVWGFADLNHNRSFEPDADLLVPADTVLVLSEESPEATEIRLRMVNPRAPARFAGTVADSMRDSVGVVRLIAISESDTTRKLVYEVAESGLFDLQWEPGTYRVRAFRDLDKNRAWKRDVEPASLEYTVVLEPGGAVTDFAFALERPRQAEPGP